MLIYDSRYRSMTIQIVALIGFLTLIGWLISNTNQNLADLGKEPSFGFMTEAAGYDINQKLLDYNSTHTHFRAAILGLLNTLLVAVLGCITATVIGVMVGVARLSNNWVVSRLMAVYVETFRNVPVLSACQRTGATPPQSCTWATALPSRTRGCSFPGWCRPTWVCGFWRFWPCPLLRSA